MKNMSNNGQHNSLFCCNNLSFAYACEKDVIQNVSFTVFPKEKVVLLGKNGSGKSTLFKLMTAVLQPTGGELYWNGDKYSRKRKFLNQLYSEIGFVFQNPDDQLFAACVEQEVSFGAVNLGLEESEVRRRVEAAMHATDTYKLKDKALENLSFGERKRVSIADLLVMNSRLLLLDEPTAWLDNKNTQEITKVLNDLNDQGIALICSTHDVDWAWQFADRVLVLNEGKLLYDGNPSRFFTNFNLLAELEIEIPLAIQADTILRNHLPEYGAETLPKTLGEISRLLSD